MKDCHKRDISYCNDSEICDSGSCLLTPPRHNARTTHTLKSHLILHTSKDKEGPPQGSNVLPRQYLWLQQLPSRRVPLPCTDHFHTEQAFWQALPDLEHIWSPSLHSFRSMEWDHQRAFLHATRCYQAHYFTHMLHLCTLALLITPLDEIMGERLCKHDTQLGMCPGFAYSGWSMQERHLNHSDRNHFFSAQKKTRPSVGDHTAPLQNFTHSRVNQKTFNFPDHRILHNAIQNSSLKSRPFCQLHISKAEFIQGKRKDATHPYHNPVESPSNGFKACFKGKIYWWNIKGHSLIPITILLIAQPIESSFGK